MALKMALQVALYRKTTFPTPFSPHFAVIPKFRKLVQLILLIWPTPEWVASFIIGLVAKSHASPHIANPPLLGYNHLAMTIEDLVIHSQHIPPRSRKGVLRRPRVEARLRAALDYPLTIVQAGTGFGKSTALAILADTIENLYWYTVAEPDRDPLLFLVHLFSAFDQSPQSSGRSALQELERNGHRVTPTALTPLLNTLTKDLTSDTLLVLDDYHLVQDVPEIASLLRQMVNYLPPYLHVVISSRQMPAFDDLPRWRAKGQVLTISRADLAFTVDEIETLFDLQYGYTLSRAQAQALAEETGGWAIALQMIWQSLQSGAVPSLEDVFDRLPATLEALFDYLAPEVLARQPDNIQRFLLTSSVLRQMSGAACDLLLDGLDSEVTLRRLYEHGFFVDAVGDGVYRYQKLFHDFLQAQLAKDPAHSRLLHRKAGNYYREIDQPEETIYHLLAAEDYELAVDQIAAIGPGLVTMGRLDSLTGWADRLPDTIRAARPELSLLLGDVCRLRADFDAALDHYLAAGRLYGACNDRLGKSRALRGQAQVYLDTIRPLKADALLEEASRLLEPQEHREEAAALFDQLAENKLNLGYPDQAQALHAEARLLRAEADPGDVYLEARAMLRTGRLAEARRLLEARAAEERAAHASRPQRFHRETVLLLSLICVMLGDAEAAEKHAHAGVAIGQELQSNFVEAVGAMRLGHPLQLTQIHPWREDQYQQAIECYRTAMEQVRPFKVMRVSVEPLWGLCRAYGYAGDLRAAEESVLRALEIAEQSGDEWIGDLARVSMGASFALAGQSEAAVEWLDRAISGFERVGDSFGRAAALLWLALNAWGQGDSAAAVEYLEALLPVARAKGYDVLLTRRTFLGLKDDQAFLPLLLTARRQAIETAYASRLLSEAGLDEQDDHPGYTVWVRTLGSFSVWRGDTLVTAHEWQREKARKLFQLLATHREKVLQREQIVDLLWPDLPPEAGIRDFKVALNALNRALEPARPRDAQPFFVIRKGNAYGLNPAARLEIDVDHFERLAASNDVASLRQALALYQDDYLPDCRYDDWAAAPRDRLAQVYLAAAGRLGQLLTSASNWDEAIALGQTALARDPCWEPGCRLLMQAYAGQGNLSQVQNAYNRCRAVLKDELGVEPSAETQALLAKLKSR